jgi:chromosome segregation ATPase
MPTGINTPASEFYFDDVFLARLGGEPPDLTACRADLAEAEAAADALLAEVAGLRSDNEALRGQLTSCEGHRSALTGQVTALIGQVDALTGQLDTVLGENQQLRSRLEALEQEAGLLEALAETLLGEKPTAAVIAVLRTETRAEIDAAIARVGADDRRLRAIERHYSEGLAAKSAGRLVMARRHFRLAFQAAERLQPQPKRGRK